MGSSPQTPRFGIDLGGTNLKLGRIERDVVVQKIEIPTEHDARLCVQQMAEKLKELAADGRLSQVGVGLPGVIDAARSQVLDAPNLPFLAGFPLADELSALCACPVVLENDANVAALGEAHCGAGKNHPNFLFITLGTGVGGGLILNHQLFQGPGGMAGEFGHLTVGHDRQCGCGALGCLEAIASARAMETLAAQCMGQAMPLAEMVEAAGNGNLDALAVFQTAGSCLGEAMAQVGLLLDLRVFLVGGGGHPALKFLEKPARLVLQQRCFGRQAEDFLILPATLGNDAGLLGAAYLEMA